MGPPIDHTGGVKWGSQKGVILAAQNEPKSGAPPMVYLHAGFFFFEAWRSPAQKKKKKKKPADQISMPAWRSDPPFHMRSTGSPTETHMYLALKDLHGPRRGDDLNRVHKCQNGKIGRLGRPSRVGNLGYIDAPSLDSQPLISPLVPRPGLWLAVTLAACCSSRGGTRGWGRKKHAVQRGGSWIAPKVE